MDELRQADEVLVVLAQARELSKPATSIPHAAEEQFFILLNQQQYPYLSDHSVNDKMVLPIAQVVEWFVQATNKYNQNDQSISLEDFQVLSGIKLANFTQQQPQQQQQLRINIKNISPSRYEAKLFDGDNKLCFRSFIVFHAHNEDSADHFVNPVNYDRHWPEKIEDIYRPDFMFHGPSYQMIHKLNAIGNNGVCIQIDTSIDQQWPNATHFFHPALLDGCLQAPGLWGLCINNKHSLPISINRILWFRQNPIKGIVSCHVNITQGTSQWKSDTLAVDVQGRPLMLLEGVSNIVYAEINEAL